jgi:hypothetical protein
MPENENETSPDCPESAGSGEHVVITPQTAGSAGSSHSDSTEES